VEAADLARFTEEWAKRKKTRAPKCGSLFSPILRGHSEINCRHTRWWHILLR
jgi:hypothetical protein